MNRPRGPSDSRCTSTLHVTLIRDHRGSHSVRQQHRGSTRKLVPAGHTVRYPTSWSLRPGVPVDVNPATQSNAPSLRRISASPVTHQASIGRFVRMAALCAPLPLSCEHRDAVPAIVAGFCDLDVKTHADIGWKVHRPTLLIQGPEPDDTMSVPYRGASTGQGLLEWLECLVQVTSADPPVLPAAAIVLVARLSALQESAVTQARVLVGVLQGGDLFTVVRVGDGDPVLVWRPEPDEVFPAVRPYVEPLAALVTATWSNGRVVRRR